MNWENQRTNEWRPAPTAEYSSKGEWAQYREYPSEGKGDRHEKGGKGYHSEREAYPVESRGHWVEPGKGHSEWGAGKGTETWGKGETRDSWGKGHSESWGKAREPADTRESWGKGQSESWGKGAEQPRESWGKGQTESWGKGAEPPRESWGKGQTESWGKGTEPPRESWGKGQSESWGKGRESWERGPDSWGKGHESWVKAPEPWGKGSEPGKGDPWAWHPPAAGKDPWAANSTQSWGKGHEKGPDSWRPEAQPDRRPENSWGKGYDRIESSAPQEYGPQRSGKGEEWSKGKGKGEETSAKGGKDRSKGKGKGQAKGGKDGRKGRSKGSKGQGMNAELALVKSFATETAIVPRAEAVQCQKCGTMDPSKFHAKILERIAKGGRCTPTCQMCHQVDMKEIRQKFAFDPKCIICGEVRLTKFKKEDLDEAQRLKEESKLYCKKCVPLYEGQDFIKTAVPWMEWLEGIGTRKSKKRKRETKPTSVDE